MSLYLMGGLGENWVAVPCRAMRSRWYFFLKTSILCSTTATTTTTTDDNINSNSKSARHLILAHSTSFTSLSRRLCPALHEVFVYSLPSEELTFFEGRTEYQDTINHFSQLQRIKHRPGAGDDRQVFGKGPNRFERLHRGGDARCSIAIELSTHAILHKPRCAPCALPQSARRPQARIGQETIAPTKQSKRFGKRLYLLYAAPRLMWLWP